MEKYVLYTDFERICENFNKIDSKLDGFFCNDLPHIKGDISWTKGVVTLLIPLLMVILAILVQVLLRL